MEKEEHLKSKVLYKILLYSLKIIPMILSGIILMNTILSYIGIDLSLFPYITTFLLLGFIYIAARVFRFCNYHKMFLHYISLNMILNIIDYEVGLPLNDRELFCMYMIITGVSLFVILFMYLGRRNE